MSLLKFTISWDEDNATFRDVEVLTNQSFHDLHTCIKTAFQFPETMEASFFMTDNFIHKGKEISSTVEKNLRDAPALSMRKTPIGALMNDPHQQFIYECVHPKNWTLHLEVISLKEFLMDSDQFPRVTKSEGISPSQFGILGQEKDAVMETLEIYDLAGDADGYGDEGEDEVISDEDMGNFTEDL